MLRVVLVVVATLAALMLPDSSLGQSDQPDGPKPGHAYMVGQSLPGVCKIGARGTEIATTYQRWFQGCWSNATWLPKQGTNECVQVLRSPGVWRMRVFNPDGDHTIRIVGPFVVVDRSECTNAETKIVRVSTPDGDTSGLEGLQGKHLLPNQELTTDANVNLDFADGSRVAIAKGSAFRLNGCSQPTAPDLPPLTTLTLMLGKIWAKVSSGTQRFEISTERVVCGNRGTTFWIAFDRPGKLTTVHVDEGSVWMRAAGQTITVAAGQTGTQHADEAPVIH
jgi:hypothetical protein